MEAAAGSLVGGDLPDQSALPMPLSIAAGHARAPPTKALAPRYGQGVRVENVRILEVTELADPVTLTGRVDLGEAVLFRGPQPGTRAFWVSWTGDREACGINSLGT